ncbi:hypothetical protein RRF57_013012 [Xylaria bambusicola]|uniref:Uncharacterized protein n=1 Tax=Xylaria bambusicola TaxID=326684 RepID=A0AAN7UR13_9PEZI
MKSWRGVVGVGRLFPEYAPEHAPGHDKMFGGLAAGKAAIPSGMMTKRSAARIIRWLAPDGLGKTTWAGREKTLHHTSRRYLS